MHNMFFELLQKLIKVIRNAGPDDTLYWNIQLLRFNRLNLVNLGMVSSFFQVGSELSKKKKKLQPTV